MSLLVTLKGLPRGGKSQRVSPSSRLGLQPLSGGEALQGPGSEVGGLLAGAASNRPRQKNTPATAGSLDRPAPVPAAARRG